MREWLGEPEFLQDPALDGLRRPARDRRARAQPAVRRALRRPQHGGGVARGAEARHRVHAGAHARPTSSPTSTSGRGGTFVDVEVGTGRHRARSRPGSSRSTASAPARRRHPRRWASTPTQVFAVAGRRARRRPRATPPAGPPLAGLRVMDFGHGAVGVEVGRRFAEYGAEVMKIESRTYTDFMRLQLGGETNPSFASSSRSKLGFGVNAKTADGRALLHAAGGAVRSRRSRTTRPARWTSSASGSTRSRR